VGDSVELVMPGNLMLVGLPPQHVVHVADKGKEKVHRGGSVTHPSKFFLSININ